MATLTVTVNINQNSTPPPLVTFTYSGDINPATGIIVVGPGVNDIELSLASGTGSPSVSFPEQQPISWFNSSNQAIAQPSEFSVSGPTSGIVNIRDNNTSTTGQVFFFKINVLANGISQQSPDPTIINKDQ